MGIFSKKPKKGIVSTMPVSEAPIYEQSFESAEVSNKQPIMPTTEQISNIATQVIQNIQEPKPIQNTGDLQLKDKIKATIDRTDQEVFNLKLQVMIKEEAANLLRSLV